MVLVAGLAASSTGALTTMQTTCDQDISPLDVSGSGNGQSHNVTVYFFYGNGCPHCAIAEPVIDSLSEKYPQVDFERCEIYNNGTNQALFQQLNSRYGVQNPVVPEVFIGDKVLIAEDAIRNDLEPEIQHMLSANNNTGNNATSTSAGVGGTNTDNASNTVSSPNNNSTMPAGPDRTSYGNSPNPVPNETIEIGVILIAAAASLAVGFVIYRSKRKKG